MLAIVDLGSPRRRRRCAHAFAGLFGLFAALGPLASPGVRAAESSGGFVDLPNVKLWVTNSGGTGDPVILLHPATGTSEIWEKQTPALVEAGYRVITIDKPGWGKSMVREGMKPISLAEDSTHSPTSSDWTSSTWSAWRMAAMPPSTTRLGGLNA